MKLARNYSLGGNLEYIASLLDNSLGHRGILKRDLDMPDADCNMEFWHKEQIIVGDVDEVLRRLLELMEESGPFGTLVLMGFGWDEKAIWIREEREKGTVSLLCGRVLESTGRPPQGPELGNDLAKGWLRPPEPAGDVHQRGNSGFRTDAEGEARRGQSPSLSRSQKLEQGDDQPANGESLHEECPVEPGFQLGQRRFQFGPGNGGLLTGANDSHDRFGLLRLDSGGGKLIGSGERVEHAFSSLPILSLSGVSDHDGIRDAPGEGIRLQ